jgi:hypothetical protein
MTLFPLLAILLLFPLIIASNVFFLHLLIKAALKSYIKPQLEAKGLYFKDYKWCGFFNTGDFKNVDIGLTTLSKTGLNSISVYTFIYYQSVEQNLEKKVTAKIDVVGISIEKVVYSNEL